MKENTTKPTNPPENYEEIEIDAESDPEELFENLNSQIDELNSVLDALEKQNENIQNELKKLLKTSREARASLGPIQEKPGAS